MQSITVVNNSTKKSKNISSNILDKYGFRIGKNIWSLNIHLKTLNILTNSLKRIATKNTNIIFYKKDQKIIEIGTKTGTQYHIKTKRQNKKSNNQILIDFVSEYHDLGKLTQQFQNLLLKNIGYEKYHIRHEYVSVLILEWVYLGGDGNNFTDYLSERIMDQHFISEHIDNENLRNAIFIIGTHHQLPKNNTNENFFRNSREEILRDIDTFKLNITPYMFKKIKQDLSVLLNVNKLSFFEKFSLRNSLILGDHIGSGFIVNQPIKKNGLHAKSADNNYQSYRSHIKLVKMYAKKHLNDFHNFDQYIDIGIKEKIKEEECPERFSWQKDSLEFIERHNQDIPKLTFLSASTGSGKTYMSLKINALISKKKRFTIVQGLRTLTMQTGKAYKEFGLFNESDILVQIGDKTVKELYDECVEPVLENSSVFNKKMYKEHFENFLNKNNFSFLNAPILISTIDYIINATDWRKSKHILPLLRIKSSDIIIDEVDQFSPEDQHSVLRLIFLCGMHNINLTLSTATPNKSLVEAYYNMYKSGVELSKIKKFQTFLINDKFNNVFEGENFINFYENENKKIINDWNLKNNIEIKDINYKNAVKYVKEIADNEYEEDVEGNRYSTVLYRVSNIKYMKKLIKNLKDWGDDYNVNVISYHSNYPLYFRYKLEKELDNLLNRKNEKLYEKELFKKTNIKKKNIILVLATPIEEQGRDHDFDGAIIDPSSVNSIAQTIGRVYRHRIRHSNSVNIFIMNESFRLQEYGDEALVYTRPGYESNKLKFHKNGKKELSELVKEVNYLQTNKHILNIDKDNNYLAYLEDKAISNEIEKTVEAIKDEGKVFNFEHLKNGGIYTDFRTGLNESGFLNFKDSKLRLFVYGKNGVIEKANIALEEESLVNNIIFDKGFFNKVYEFSDYESEKYLSVNISVYSGYDIKEKTFQLNLFAGFELV